MTNRSNLFGKYACSRGKEAIMWSNFDGVLDSGADRSSERPDPVARRLFIIIMSAVVFAIAVIEVWAWLN